MKAIELTLLQQEKLLEMCKALFPEYNKFWLFPIKGDTFIIEASQSDNLTLIPTLQIHWFEFCMTHLAEKFSQYPNQIIVEHPVDYLYEEFKKLPIKDDKVTKVTYKCIERITGINESELTANSKLSELGLDDLDEVELIMDLEKELGIVIPDDDVETKIFKKGNTIQTLVDYLKGKL